MTHRLRSGSASNKGTGLRDLLSSVAQSVESHLQPYYTPASSPPTSPSRSPSTSSATLTATSPGKRGRRPSRIRSWIGHDRERLKDGEQCDNSLEFTDADALEDEFLGCRREPGGQGHEHVGRDSNARSRDGGEHNPNQHLHPQSQSHLRRAPSKHQDRNPHPDRHPHPNPYRNADQRDITMHVPDERMVREEETVGVLIGLMGDGFDREVVRRVLRKYDGNVDKAAGALVEGERGEEVSLAMGSGTGAGSGSGQGTQLQQPQAQQSQGNPIQIQSQGWPPVASGASGWALGAGSGTGTGTQAGLGSQTPQTRLGIPDVPPALGGRPNTPIDLTLDDDPDLQRAMQESMNTFHHGSQAYAPSYGAQGMGMQQTQQPMEGPVFGPSERPPDSSWAMVPSQQMETNDDLQNLNRAIEASLEAVGDSDALEPFPVEQQLRRDGCPVVLRPSMHTMVYAASILQGLFYVPQVAPPMNGPDFTLWALSEIFTHMDLARLCDLNVDKRLPAFNIESWDRPAQPPGELSRKFFARLAATLERAFIEQFARDGQPLPKPRLLHFQYGSGISEPGELLQETSIVPIDVNGGESNDLIGRLSAQLSKPQSEPGKQSVIFEPSEVVAFELVRVSSTPSTSSSGGGSDKKAFTYPKSIYLDQFLRENVELAQAKRKQRREMLEEVQRLVLHKKTLSHFDGKDTLKDLRSAIFYFEDVADAKGDSERDALIQATTRKLKSILVSIEEGIKETDEKIDMLRTQAETLLECEELHRFKYDLRVVFVHDGFYGRKHLYSYVHDKSCWWKIADALIEKVPEEIVLNDQVGLHLGAGPYLLFYSRAMENEGPALQLPWMDDIKDDVRVANREFLSQLPPELVGDIVIDEDVLSVKNGGTSERMDMS